MKKAIFLILALGFTSFGIYSCQKDSAEKTVQSITPNVTVSDRADFSDCEDCSQTCEYCCLELECTSGPTTFGFINPATGNPTTRTLYSAGKTYVCAADGWVAIFAPGGGKITSCSTGAFITKSAGGANVQEQLTYECNFTPY